MKANFESLKGEQKFFQIWYVDNKTGFHKTESFSDAQTTQRRLSELFISESIDENSRCQVRTFWEHKGWSFPKFTLPPEVCYWLDFDCSAF